MEQRSLTVQTECCRLLRATDRGLADHRNKGTPVQIQIACRHGHIRDDVRELISQKSAKLLTYFERVTAIVVTIDLKVADHVKVEIQVDAEHKHDFVASQEGADVAATFDQALHKMEHQITKYKEKVQDHRRDLPLNEYAKDDATA